MVLTEQFQKFTGKKDLDYASRYDYHLCICKEGDGKPYYSMVEYSRFGWIVEDDEIEILAYCDLMLSPEDVLKQINH